MGCAEIAPHRPLRGGAHPLPDDRGEFCVAIDLPERDLPAGDQADEQEHGGVLGRQRPLRLDPAPELLMQALDDVGRPERLRG